MVLSHRDCHQLIVRFVVLTAMFSACGMDFITFSISAIVAFPKQFVFVFVGHALEQSGTHSESSPSSPSTFT
jgi:hypothetical protein